MNINIQDVSFKYQKNIIFDNLNLEIKKDKITSIIGPNGCGKTTLIKIITGILNFKGNVIIGEYNLKKHFNEIRKQIGFVLEETSNQFISEIVIDELAFSLENLNFNRLEIENRIEEVAELLKIDEILQYNVLDLNNSQKQLLDIAKALIHEPKILILDNVFNYLDPNVKDEIFKVLRQLNKKGVTIVFTTNDIEDTLISDEIVVIDKEDIFQGNKKDIYNQEKRLNKLGIKLPFIIELSNRMMFYELIDETVYDMKEMVDLLWK